MTKTWANRASERFHIEGKSSPFRSLDVEIAQNRLAYLNAVSDLREISPLKSMGLHKLKGDRAGQLAINVNDRWRICFRFKDGDAYDVEITDYHRG